MFKTQHEKDNVCIGSAAAPRAGATTGGSLRFLDAGLQIALRHGAPWRRVYV